MADEDIDVHELDNEDSLDANLIAQIQSQAIAPESSIAVREFTKWTDEMDFRLLSAMLDEARQKSLKNRWREVHDLFSGLSGFAWDESTKRFSVEPEVWDELLTTKPSAAKWRVNLIRYYDRWKNCGVLDRATWHMAGRARQRVGISHNLLSRLT
ncbi:hypothetical protein Fmac_029363 [Flemingia macrophylla]|uniref:Myb/SANT-like domain-containing protein n=1 Tax=Flemingia macrophylla TaxID=520843 RepID=A0ABD1LA43_9FABA